MTHYSSRDGEAGETWNYRVIELRKNGETWRGFHEVYYTDGALHSYTERPVGIAWLLEEGEPDPRHDAARLHEALSKPVLTPTDFPKPEPAR